MDRTGELRLFVTGAVLVWEWLSSRMSLTPGRRADAVGAPEELAPRVRAHRRGPWNAHVRAVSRARNLSPPCVFGDPRRAPMYHCHTGVAKTAARCQQSPSLVPAKPPSALLSSRAARV